MIADEERREAAKELRLRSCCGGFESCDKCKALSVRLFGDKWVLCKLDSCDANYWGALADLIDRLATTRHGKFKTKYGRETPCCEVCGYSIGDMRWNYCPKCGAVITDAK